MKTKNINIEILKRIKKRTKRRRNSLTRQTNIFQIFDYSEQKEKNFQRKINFQKRFSILYYKQKIVL